ncbi:MAG: hypothetical protein NUV68_03110 [Caldiserica bacterium]|jgi:hypothetical protein|nr:hypothetical protein [Caldisericota bacterium]MDH7562468.1 hypothetical protein [Caldisericota bacterium]
MEIEGKEGMGFFLPPKKKIRREKKLVVEEEVFEPADSVWDEEEIPNEIEEVSPDLPEEEDEPLPL